MLFLTVGKASKTWGGRLKRTLCVCTQSGTELHGKLYSLRWRLPIKLKQKLFCGWPCVFVNNCGCALGGVGDSNTRGGDVVVTAARGVVAKSKRSGQELLGIARSCQELAAVSRNCCQELPEADRSCQESPEAARNC